MVLESDLQAINAGKGVEKREPSYTVVGMQTSTATMENSVEIPLKTGNRTAILRESVPRQVDRESRGPQGERGLEFSRRKKGQSLDSTFCYLKMLIMGVDLVFTRMYLA